MGQRNITMESKNTITQQQKDYNDDYLVSLLPGFSNGNLEVNGIKLHYVVGGQGEPLVLLAGWPQTWWSFNKIMPLLATHHKVIVVDFRGMGSSEKPTDGYTKKNMANDIVSLVKKLGFNKVSIAGHDIGANIAISFAGHFPEYTDKLIVLDTQHPEEDLYKLPMLPIGLPVHPWWVAFTQVEGLPEELLEGRFGIVQEWMFDKMLVNKDSISHFDRTIYAKAYNAKDAIRASSAWYQAFPQDIQDIKVMPRIDAPTLGIASSGSIQMLKASLPNYVKNVTIDEVKNSGHFLQEEQPQIVADLILNFLNSKL